MGGEMKVFLIIVMIFNSFANDLVTNESFTQNNEEGYLNHPDYLEAKSHLEVGDAETKALKAFKYLHLVIPGLKILFQALLIEKSMFMTCIMGLPKLAILVMSSATINLFSRIYNYLTSYYARMVVLDKLEIYINLTKAWTMISEGIDLDDSIPIEEKEAKKLEHFLTYRDDYLASFHEMADITSTKQFKNVGKMDFYYKDSLEGFLEEIKNIKTINDIKLGQSTYFKLMTELAAVEKKFAEMDHWIDRVDLGFSALELGVAIYESQKYNSCVGNANKLIR